MKKSSKGGSDYKFLSNNPLGEDTFKSRAQERIALTIKKKILAKPELNVIGIDGEWGSGKSNLIKILQKDKELNKTHSVFVYDVWGHQEDEQRRAILEELTNFITKNKLVDDEEKWQKKYKNLLKRVKEVTSKKKPILSVGLIISLLALLLTPVTKAFGDEFEGWIKYIVYAIPVLIILFAYLYFLCKFWKEKNTFNRAAVKLFEIYNRDQLVENYEEFISERTPSVNKFRTWLKEIENDLDKEIIIVFDNFDRLPKEHIKKLWSSIHIFFAEEESYEKIKVILPFDREHIRNAFDELNHDIKDNELELSFADDYINKTFDVVFRIPKPIMSDWKEFFRQKWREVFGESKDLNATLQTYDFLNPRKTPREIIAFLNEVLAIKLMNVDYKKRYIGIFILKKDWIIKNTLNAISDLSYLEGLELFYKTDKEYVKQITAITYTIDVDDATENIFRNQLIDSLNKGDFKSFKKISQAPFFEDFLVNATYKVTTYSNAVNVLGQAKEEIEDLPSNFNQCWKIVYRHVEDEELSLGSMTLEDWQLTLIKNAPNNKYLNKIINRFYNLITEGGSVRDLVRIMDKLPKSINGVPLENYLRETTTDGNEFLKVLNWVGHDYKKYKINCNLNELDEHLASLKIDQISAIKNSDILFRDFKLPKFLQSLKDEFSEKNDKAKNEIILIKLKESIPYNGKLKDVLGDRQIYELYRKSNKEEIRFDLISMRLIRGRAFSNQFKSGFSKIIDSTDEALIKSVSNVILDYTDYPELLMMFAKNSDDSELLKRVLFDLMESEFLERENYNIIEIIKKGNYSKIKERLNPKTESLIKSLDIGDYSLEALSTNINDIDSVFVNDCIKLDKENIECGILNVLKKALNYSFEEFGDDDIKNVFEEQSGIFFDYFNLIEDDYLTQNSFNIFQKVFKEKFYEDSLNEKMWNILDQYQSNNDFEIKTLFGEIKDDLFSGREIIDLRRTKKVLPYFFNQNILMEEENVFSKVLKSEFLKDKSFVLLLNKFKKDVEYIYKNATNAEKKPFRKLALELGGEDQEGIKELIKQLDIRKSKRDKE